MILGLSNKRVICTVPVHLNLQILFVVCPLLVATKGVFHRHNFPIDRVLCWKKYSYLTMVNLLAFYFEVPDLHDHIEEVKFETAEGNDSPWSRK